MDLQKSETLQKLVFPDFVNRSIMSPSGVLLATISDDPYLYIHQKQSVQKSKKESWKPGSEVASDDEWSLLCAVQIEGQRPEERSDMRGSFAVCFSNTGRYLAVATQYGLISVFDVETITEKDSLRAVFTTSRPSTGI
jgi:WD40 repeat protein